MSSWQSRKSDFATLTSWWDEGKSRLKGLTIGFCKRRNSSKRQECSVLSHLAYFLKAKIDSGSLSLVGTYHSVLSRLKQLDFDAARGAQVRSRVKWVEQGETSSAYFFGLEKKRSVDRHISALRSVDGSLVSDKDGLCEVFRSFYSDLFSASPCDLTARELLLSRVVSSLSVD